jgi:fluoride exporter
MGAGAMLGAWLRWTAGLWLNAAWPLWPLGTWVVNCVGGLLMGVCMVALMRWPSETARLFWMTGLLGGLTTFSAFSAESLHLLHRGEWLTALSHTLAHVLGALACAALGFALAKAALRLELAA